SIVNVRSRVEVTGITNSISRSNKRAIIANAIPVFPLVASINFVCLLISPLCNALRIMFKAGLSFTLPPGLSPSSFAYIFTAGFGFNLLISTNGVLPTRSMMLAINNYLSGNNFTFRSEEHTSELQSRENLVCRLLLEKKKLIQFIE